VCVCGVAAFNWVPGEEDAPTARPGLTAQLDCPDPRNIIRNALADALSNREMLAPESTSAPKLGKRIRDGALCAELMTHNANSNPGWSVESLSTR